MMAAVVIFSIAIALAIISAAMLALAFGTDFWLSVTVDLALTAVPGRANRVMSFGPNVGRIFYSRNAGLWRECFVDRINTTWILFSPSVQGAITEGNCFIVDYEMQPASFYSSASFSDAYWTMIHLRRAVIAFFICALILLVCGSIIGAAGCWQSASRYAKFAGLVILLATAFASAGMAFWHGAEFVERNGVLSSDPRHLQRNWPEEVRRASVLRYGWSYICAWIATTLAAMSSAVYLLAALWIVRHKETHTYYPPKMYCLPPSTYHHGSYHGSYPGPYTAFPVEEYFYAKAPVSATNIQRILTSANGCKSQPQSIFGTSSTAKQQLFAQHHQTGPSLSTAADSKLAGQTLDYIY